MAQEIILTHPDNATPVAVVSASPVPAVTVLAMQEHAPAGRLLSRFSPGCALRASPGAMLLRASGALAVP